MKIGLIIYSQTGHTLEVAERLRSALTDAGHEVKLEQITAEASNPKEPLNVTLQYAPDASAYDLLYFGAPVQAFSLCPAMKAYLRQAASLRGKRVGCFTTQQLKFAWMGGNRAIRQMSDAIAQKGGEVAASGIVHWSHPQRETMIQRVVNELATVSPVNV